VSTERGILQQWSQNRCAEEFEAISRRFVSQQSEILPARKKTDFRVGFAA
jgi:hypothetical protein